MQVADGFEVFSMLDGDELRRVVETERPDLIVPEIEAIAADTLVELESEGFRVYEGEWWHFEYGTPRWAAIREAPGCYQIAELQNPVSFSQSVVHP